MNSPVEKAKLIIARNFREAMSLEELAAEIGLSKFHFHRVFRRETGVTPHDYILAIRLDHAAHMIVMYPQASLTDIAFETGFSSPSVFSRAFKARFGQSPLAYRKQMQPTTGRSLPEQPGTLPLTFFDRKLLRVEATNLIRGNINPGMQRVVAGNGYNGKIYGIFMDAPMHKKPEESRYYFGAEHEFGEASLTYEIENGYYTYLDIQGDFSAVVQRIVEFKETQIDPSPYEIESLVGFEMIAFKGHAADFDYFSVPRRIFIKVKRR